MPAVRGFLSCPPYALNTAMPQITQETGSGHDGHYHAGKGEIHGSSAPKPQDTYITGTASRTGRAFTVTTGTWRDDYVNPETGKYELLRPASSGAFDIVSTSTTPTMEAAEIILGRGLNPIGTTATQANYFCFVYFAYGSLTDYRFGWEYGKPAHLDFTADGWATYNIIGVCRNIGNTDVFLHDHNYQVRLALVPDNTDNTIFLTVSNKDNLYNVQTDGPTGLRLVLPQPGKIRLVGQDGWVSMGYLPYRYKPVVIVKSPTPLPATSNPEAARIVTNGRGETDDTQTVDSTLNIIGVTIGGPSGAVVPAIGHTTTATMPDAGDGLGSAIPPKIVDATIITPSTWITDIGGIVNPFTEIDFAAGMNMQLLEVFDDATRTRSASCLIPINNWRSQYSGTFAHAATAITATNGVDGYWKAFEGIAGVGDKGWEFDRSDPLRLLYMPCADYSYAMQVPLSREVTFDGWCIFSAVRFLAECGNCHPSFMQSIPLYVPPGASYDAPYGPAGSDCPFFILAKGTGLNAKYRFTEDTLVWSVLQVLVQDAGETDPITGANIPYYMGFTEDGQFHFEPYNPNFYNPVIAYSDTVSSGDSIPGYGLIEEFHLFNSVMQMRTSIEFHGIDAWTNQFLYYNVSLPDNVLRAVGFRFPWVDRVARYASYDYMVTIANSAARQASLPTQVIHMKVPYHPQIHAGNVCIVSESATLLGTNLFYITELRSQIGIKDLTGRHGHQDCFSWVTCRAIQNF